MTRTVPRVFRPRLRPVPYFLAACFPVCNLFSPCAATAADNTITGGTYTDVSIYGNTGDSTAPTDTNASNNTLTLGADGMAAAGEVTDGGDAGAGTLREVVGAANSGDNITFAPGVGTVTISDAPAITVGTALQPKTNLTITGNIGPGGRPTTITMSGATRANPIFLNEDDDGSGLTLANLVFDNIQVSLGHSVHLNGGGLVSAESNTGNNAAATLGLLDNVSFTGNEVTVTGSNNLAGGGLVGAYSSSGAATVGDTGAGATFTGNTVTVSSMYLRGGGLVGAESDSGAATVGDTGAGTR